MGLCKCRKVSNLFCFSHKKNVCETCLVSDHPRCVIKSYLSWLQDSDFSPLCSICSTSLDNGTLVRLMCLDLFHVDCLNKVCNEKPNTTAPAGYTCPVCSMGIIPSEGAGGAVANGVRIAFGNSDWGKGLIGPVVETVVPVAVEPDFDLKESFKVTDRTDRPQTLKKKQDDPDDKYGKRKSSSMTGYSMPHNLVFWFH